MSWESKTLFHQYLHWHFHPLHCHIQPSFPHFSLLHCKPRYQLYFCMTTLSSRPLQCNQVVFCSYKIKWWQWSPYIPHHHECLHITKSNLDISMLSTCQPHVFSMYQALLYNRCQSFLLLSITMLFLLLVYYLVQWSMMHGLFIIMGGDHLFECISKKTCSSNGRI